MNLFMSEFWYVIRIDLEFRLWNGNFVRIQNMSYFQRSDHKRELQRCLIKILQIFYTYLGICEFEDVVIHMEVIKAKDNDQLSLIDFQIILTSTNRYWNKSKFTNTLSLLLKNIVSQMPLLVDTNKPEYRLWVHLFWSLQKGYIYLRLIIIQESLHTNLLFVFE